MTLTCLFSIYTIWRLFYLVQNGRSFLTISEAESAISISIFFFSISFLFSAIFFIAWMYKAYKNLATFGKTDNSLALTIWGWFLPLVWYFIPFELMNEMWVKFQRGSKAQSKLSLWLWWGLCIIFPILWYMGMQEISTNFNLGITELFVSNGLALFAAILGILVIRKITIFEQAAHAHALIEKIEGGDPSTS